jgi:hypothetical protein
MRNFLMLVIIAATAFEEGRLSAEVVDATITVEPSFQRIALPPGATAMRQVTIRSPVDGIVSSARVECRCLAITSLFPIHVDAGKSVKLDFQVTGVLPGIKTVMLDTSLGPTQFQVQVVTDGLGVGSDVLRTILAKAAADRLTPWFLIHDLRGEIRNCGCSDGSLGGVDVLAGLATMVTVTNPGARFLLSGDIDGNRPGVGAQLKKFGWTMDEDAVVVTGDPAAILTKESVVAVISTARTAIQHRKILRPIAAGGMVAQVLLLDADRHIREFYALPIDRTLPHDPRILPMFATKASFTLDVLANPSDSCKSCHSTAYQAWASSRHAVALSSLAPENRTDDCIGCHSLLISASAPVTRVANVQCQSCHLGSDAHAQEPAGNRTSGVVDCRACHDSRHHPGLDRAAGWLLIGHGR